MDLEKSEENGKKEKVAQNEKREHIFLLSFPVKKHVLFLRYFLSFPQNISKKGSNESNKIGTNVQLFIAATGKAGLCAFFMLIATIGSRKSYKSKMLHLSRIELRTSTI